LVGIRSQVRENLRGGKFDILPSFSYADSRRSAPLLGWLRKFSRPGGPDAGRAQALFRDGERANSAGRHREAAGFLIAAIEAEPNAAEFHYELGRAMRRLNEPARAVTCFRRAIELDAKHLDARVDLAAVLLGLGNAEAAEAAARDALSLDARSVAAHINLGAALQGRGAFAAAADSYRAALAIDANAVPALAELAGVCLRLGSMEEASRSIERALQLAPDSADLHLRQASILLEQKRPQDAAQSYREALRCDPGSAAAHNGLGFVLDTQGRTDEALASYEKVLALDPDNVQAHLNRSAVWLLREDYARGWPEYEWRLRDPGQAPVHGRFGQPRWDGAPLAGRRILVYAEQGLGDEIMYASCLPEVIAQAAHCVIDCEPRLAKLFQRSFPQATVHGGGQSDAADWLAQAGPVDLQIPTGSLPLYLRRSAASFPRHSGYLRAAPELVAAWRERLGALGPGPKIGLSWRGGVAQTSRGMRSLQLAELLPILRAGGASFVNLQYGPHHDEIAQLERAHGVKVHHWPAAIDDYEETAALVSALDLTISVCTAVVHLGGALGRPVWVMAPVRPEPRYGLRGETMRWYPSVRMFRQQDFGDWQPVISAVAAALENRS
jgi:tetratricopeptide (TPR) repeat protein